jgi:hypothetical protein
MDQSTQHGLPPSLVNGRLEGLSVPDLLWNLCRHRSTGVLHLTSRDITKRVYFDAGRIVFALSGDPNDRLGERLLRDGLITLDQFEGALSQLSSGRRLGTILVSAGHLSPDNLVRGVLQQVKGIVLALFPLEEGEYAFVEGPLPTEEVITLGMRTAEILLQGIRQIRSFSRIRKSVGPLSTRFQLSPTWHEVLDGLDIRDGERMLLKRLDEAGARGVSVDAMCREVFLSNFEIYQALWAFLVLGIVEAVGGSEEQFQGAVISGRLERTNLPEILVRLCRDERTGVLHMSRGTLERSLHIKDGTCIFATSSAVDDGLVAHLLRRGVISLADREETARRLLSNKRVGAILIEMGVIDDADLHATVREQLSEIIFDTFRWDEGDFCFLEGDLPTIEEITLSRTVEDLVFAGVRRVTSWPRVRQGCGGLNARLVLLPRYLSVLDKMTVGPEEWELISLLKTPKSVVEICRESVLGDFRSCQILWALRILGGVGEAPMELSIDSALGAFESPRAAAPAPTASAPTEAPPALVAPPEVHAAPLVDAVPEVDPAVVVDAVPPVDVAPPAPAAPELPAVVETPVVAEPPAVAEEIHAAAAETEQPLEVEAAPEPEAEIEPEIEAQPVREPDPDPTPVPLSDTDSTAEVITETWRLAAQTRPESDTIAISAQDREAALRGPAEPPSRFELAEPGTGIGDIQVDDTKIDMRPHASAPDRTDAQPEPAPSDPDRTARVSPEELEAVLKAPEPPPALPPFVPPYGLEGAIASFNARHVVLFRALRAEIGAGAANFVRSCRGGLDHGLGVIFESAELRADGSWDPDGLRRSVVEHRVTNASDGFRALLNDELQRLRAHLGEARAAALANQLATIP